MAPVHSETSTNTSSSVVPEVVTGEDGCRVLRVVVSLPTITSPRQIAVRPHDDRLLIFRVGEAHILQHELLHSVQLPESLDPFTVEANVNAQGQLVVQAPLISLEN